MKPDERIKKLEREVEALRDAFTTAIGWIASSANSPLSAENGLKLIKSAWPKGE